MHDLRFPRLIFSGLLLSAALLPAQEREESPIGGTPAVEIVRDKPDQPEIEKAIEQLDEAWGEKPGSEAELRAVRQVVSKANGELSKSDAEQLVVAMRKIIGKGKLLLPEREPVYREAIEGLSRFGAVGGEALLRVYESDRIPTRPETQQLRGKVLVALADTGHPRVRELLIETVRTSSEPQLTAAAGRGMRVWADAPREERQPLVEVLARRMAGLENVASRRPADPARYRDLDREDAEDDLKTVREVWNPVLAELTGVRYRTGQEWWEWYQENREKRWPADPKPEEGRRRRRR